MSVDRLALCREAIETKSAYEKLFGSDPEDRGGWYHPADWGRTTWVLSALDSGTRVLDVGAGAGQFANMIAASGKFEEVVALDRSRFRKYTELSDVVRRVDASIESLDFPDGWFDVVCCMEVLEHVPVEVFEAGLRELRRVCGGQLVMTVPFEEPLPLSKGHVRRFVPSDIVSIFPDGRYTILNRPRMPWILIEEHIDGRPFAPVEELSLDQWRVADLEAELARLKQRRSLRWANWVGATLRQARRRLVSVVRHR